MRKESRIVFSNPFAPQTPCAPRSYSTEAWKQHAHLIKIGDNDYYGKGKGTNIFQCLCGL